MNGNLLQQDILMGGGVSSKTVWLCYGSIISKLADTQNLNKTCLHSGPGNLAVLTLYLLQSDLNELTVLLIYSESLELFCWCNLAEI